MNPEKIENALEAVQVFKERAKDALSNKPVDFICGTKETGALKRASMELTRALAELRRPS